MTKLLSTRFAVLSAHLILTASIICASSVETKSAPRPTVKNTVQNLLTPAGTIDLEKAEEFRQQYLQDTKAEAYSNAYSNAASPSLSASQPLILLLDSTKNLAWDGAQWVDSMRLKYFHNVDADLEYSFRENWVAGQWEYDLNMGHTYDAENRLVERIDQDWSNSNFEYVLTKTIFTYDFQDRVTDSVLQFWSQHFERWEDFSIHSMIYDIQGNQIDLLFQIFQHSVEGWEPDYRVLSTYDDNNNITKEEYLFWNYDETTWDSTTVRTVFIYDNQQNLIDSTLYYREMDDLVWANGMTYTYTYDNNNNRIGELHHFLDEFGVWHDTWRHTLTFDANNNEISHLWEFHSDEEGWSNILLEESSHNNDMITERLSSGWSNRRNSWTLFYKQTYDYDSYGNQIFYQGSRHFDGNFFNEEQRSDYFSELVSTSTGAGANVETTLQEGIVMLFDSVNTAGASAVALAFDGPTAEEYDIFPPDSSAYYYISTNAEYTGQIEICITYPSGILTEEQETNLRLLHHHEGQWVDITTTRNTSRNQICGSTSNLSPFALGIAKIQTDVTQENSVELPVSYSLNQNYPNPFNPATTISYSLPKSSQVEITVYNILGRKLRTLINKKMSAGNYSVSWDGTNADGQSVSSGMYLYRIKTETFSTSKKMLLLK